MPLSNNGAASRRQPLGDIANRANPLKRHTTGIPKITPRSTTAAAKARANPKAERLAPASSSAGAASTRPTGRRTVAGRAQENSLARRTAGSKAASTIKFTARPESRAAAGRRGLQRQEEDDEMQAHVQKLVAEEFERQHANGQESSKQHVHEQMAKMKDDLLNSMRDKDSSQITDLKAKVIDAESRVRKAEENASSKDVAANQAAIEMAKKEHAFDMCMHALESKLEAEKSRRDALQEDLKSLHVTMAALEADKKFVEKKACDKDEEIINLQKKYAGHGATTEQLKREIEDSKSALQRAADDKAEIDQKLTEAKGTMRDLQKAVCDHEMDSIKKDSQLKKLTSESETATADLAETRTLLQTERDLVSTLRASAVEMERRVSDISRQHGQEIADVKHEAETMRVDMETKLRALQDEKESKLRALQDEKDRVQASLQQRSVELEGARSDVAQFRSTVVSQEGALTALKSQLSAVEVRLSAQSEVCTEKANENADLKVMLEKKSEEIVKLEEQAHVDEDERRKLHNSLQELKGNIRVFCRVRPLLAAEKKPESTIAGIFEFHNKSRGISAIVPEKHAALSRDGLPASSYGKKFNFDRVFGPASTQDDVFGEISQLVQSALDGYRVCIFAYGQTGSGKTHTIMGNESNLGMIPRSVMQIFERAARMEKDQWTFEFRASFLEIYNEKIRDLLVKGKKPVAGSSKGPKGKGDYEITYDTAANKTNIEGLTVTPVTRPEDASRLIATASKNRSTAATLSNEESSRSHSVFRLYISGKSSASGQELSGVLNLVDLAGSERVKVSGAEGDRLKESKAINKSLSQLSTVIQSLANRDKHIPYRSSKLTRVLQDSLGGDSKTLMFVNVAPVPESYNESLCSLRFAEQVNACEIGTAKRSTKIDLSSSGAA